jgi:aryl-phospho-beta-D-glucosidase BglC (GH1 family)
MCAASGPLLPSGYLHTSGSRIVDAAGHPVRLMGVNWYGFDCNSMVAGGLDHQTVDFIYRQIVQLGFNSIRLPFSVQAVQDNPPITNYLDANPALQGKTVLEIMDVIIATARENGLKVILDNHRSEAGWSTQSNGLWYTQAYPESSWISTWQTMVQRYANDSTVIGCDLRNEPGSPALDPGAWPQNGGSEWGFGDPNPSGQSRDWAAAAERPGNAILSINPNLLIFVEGVRTDPAGPFFGGAHQSYWPGGNLMGVGNAADGRPAPRPLALGVPNRLVYSAHDYGTDISTGLPWCQLGTTASTPDACRSVWDQTWGYIARNGIAPVWIGEFGTPNGHKPGDTTPPQDYTDVNDVNPQGNWFSYLVQYIEDLGLSWCYWAINGTQSLAPGRDPSNPDYYGILDPSWSGVASRPMTRRLRIILLPRWTSLGGRINSGLSAIQNQDGRLDVFSRGTDGALWHISQTAPNDGWSAWSSLGGQITARIAAARNADGRLAVFVRGTDGALWQNAQTAPNAGWSAWAPLGGAIDDLFAPAQHADGRLAIFARGDDGALWHTEQTQPNGAWGPWSSLGVQVEGALAVIANAGGRLEVFSRSPSGAVEHISETAPGGSWSGWESLDGSIGSLLAPGRNQDGRLEVFADGTDGALWHIWQTAPGDGWSGWNSLGGQINEVLSVASNLDGRLEVFARGTDGALYHQWQRTPNGDWSGWVTMGGQVAGLLAVSPNADGRLEAFVRGTDGALWHTWQTAPGNGWSF